MDCQLLDGKSKPKTEQANCSKQSEQEVLYYDYENDSYKVLPPNKYVGLLTFE